MPKRTEKYYASYPRHQDLGAMIAIRDLEQDAAEIFRQLASGEDVYREARDTLQDRQAQFHAIAMPTDVLPDELAQLAIEFQANYTFAYGVIQVLGPLSPVVRQKILAQPDSKYRMRWLHNHYAQLARLADNRRSQREMELEYMYGG